jgi:hypothetical protein
LLSYIAWEKKWEMKEIKKTCRCFGEINPKIIVVISSLVNGSLFNLQVIFTRSITRCPLPKNVKNVSFMAIGFHLIHYVNH